MGRDQRNLDNKCITEPMTKKQWNDRNRKKRIISSIQPIITIVELFSDKFSELRILTTNRKEKFNELSYESYQHTVIKTTNNKTHFQIAIMTQ